MRVTLEIVDGPYRGRRLAVRSGYVLQIGRTEWADVALPEDRHLSGVHFAVECGGGECRLRDLKSANGTRVNGRPVLEIALRDRDEIEAGQSRFVVHVEDAAPPGTSALPEPTATHVPHRPAAPRKITPPQTAQPEAASAEPAASLACEPAGPPERTASHAGAAMRVVLEAVEGPSEKKRISLLAGQSVQVGRTDRADLVFPLDFQMSSLHFAVAFQRSGCRLRDLNSTNGTLVNGNRVTETPLADGDRIQAGQTVFAVRIEGGGPSPETAPSSPAACFRTAIEDEDPGVRQEAMLAAVWTRQPWLLDHCRMLSAAASLEHWDAILWLAVLGKPQDLPTMLAIGRTEELGPRRFEALGAYGHPAVVEVLLQAIASEKPEDAAAAAEAFGKITGTEVEADDPRQARAFWSSLEGGLSRSTRCCRGLDLSQGASDEILSQVEMQSRWEIICREQYEGTRRRSLIDVETLK